MLASAPYQRLEVDRVVHTLERLSKRIRERLPGADLAYTCGELLEVGLRAKGRAAAIARPIGWLRLVAGMLITAIVVVLTTAAASVRVSADGLRLTEVVQAVEAGISASVFIGAGVVFLLTAETRVRRRRALEALHELRCLAHIIDMHQLTRDPPRVVAGGQPTPSSPDRTMSQFELSRYLDYCTEMLSLIGKIAAVYAQHFPDAVVVAAVNDVENLTTGLSRKIWQKLTLLHAEAREPAVPAR